MRKIIVFLLISGFLSMMITSCSTDKTTKAREFLNKYCSVSLQDITDYDNVSDWDNTTDAHIEKLNGKFKDFLSEEAYEFCVSNDTYRELIKNSKEQDCILKPEQIKLIEKTVDDDYTEYKYKVTTAGIILGTNITKEIKQEGIIRIDNSSGNKIIYLEPKKCSGF